MTSTTTPSPERRRRSRVQTTPSPDSPVSDQTESPAGPTEEEREEQDNKRQAFSGDPSAAEPGPVENEDDHNDEDDDDDDDDDNGDKKMKEDETSSPGVPTRSLPSLAPAPTQSSGSVPMGGSASKKGPRRRQPPHYREIRARVQSIADKFLPILGDIALANVGQLRVDDLSSKINAVYGELILLRRFLEQDSPDDISLANNSIITAVPGRSPVPPATAQFQTIQMQMVGPDGNPVQSSDAETNGHADRPVKRQRLADETASPAGDEMIRPVFRGIAHAEQPKDVSAGSTPAPTNPNLPLSDNELHIAVVETYRALPHSSRPSYDTGVSLLNEKRREKLWAVMQNEIFTFAVGYNSTPLRATEDFCALAYSQDGRMKRTLKNDLAISEALFDGVSGFRKRLYQTDGKQEAEDAGDDEGEGSGLKDCGIRAYTNNLYSLKSKPQNYYHYLFAAAFWRWVRDEIDSKTVVSSSAGPSAQPEFAVNSVEDWWRECVSICNGFLKANPGRPEKKAFLKERLLADEKRYIEN
ncbi:hypothetical protein V1525DRAFT_282951 [Lipomyces kononenkoae]|uniref:Uncharacterized protein n=1 Tax=Lipomyces kononenkoae TaxID=34357 RepID=A0ACC3SU73_LIPKO